MRRVAAAHLIITVSYDLLLCVRDSRTAPGALAQEPIHQSEFGGISVLKKLAAAGAIAAAIGGAALTAAPAQADLNAYGNNGAGNHSIVPAQVCRGVDVVGIGGAVHNVLGFDNEQGPCVNGPVSAQG